MTTYTSQSDAKKPVNDFLANYFRSDWENNRWEKGCEAGQIQYWIKHYRKMLTRSTVYAQGHHSEYEHAIRVLTRLAAFITPALRTPEIGDTIRLTGKYEVIAKGEGKDQRIWVKVHDCWFSPDDYEVVNPVDEVINHVDTKSDSV